MLRAAFTTLGCKVNQYETQRILESFEGAGFQVVPFEGQADVYVINSCSVTSVAESKSRYTVRRATRYNPAAKVVVTGCAAQMSVNKGEAFAGADVLVPNPEKLETLSWLFRAFPELERELALGVRGQARALAPLDSMASGAPISEHTESAGKPAHSQKASQSVHAAPQGRSRATVKIQDGCSVFCSYCSIPFTRPGMRSRPAMEVLDEVARLAELGYREVVLTGVLIGSYGPESGSDGPAFEDLVEKIARIEGMSRVRISSIEAPQVSDRLVALMQGGLAVPHLHIPLQSGDTGVLKDMNRRYAQDDYIRLCHKLYEAVPDLSITTDIMVGFPTEDEERFASTLHVCEEVRYLKGHVFRFSPRWGTPADQWGDPVSPEEKQRRSVLVQQATQRTGEAHARRFLGRTMRVLAEGKENRDGLMHGLTDNYLEVAFAAPPSIARTCVWVRLDEARNGTLYGELAPEPTQANGRLVLRQ
ncbi:MAG: tRNA (N(6)-L-threonylcarbamoyladenosine(37)-C(2))-methylthiotransferase MtaB [Armatimonadetes bacterium]|nr:tRNA (N(6)-L-threonylcarbamoyladenosine(37)-C(2))-methylthiotransferase MtaB [Armatimonadota bacterium]